MVLYTPMLYAIVGKIIVIGINQIPINKTTIFFVLNPFNIGDPFPFLKDRLLIILGIYSIKIDTMKIDMTKIKNVSARSIRSWSEVII